MKKTVAVAALREQRQATIRRLAGLPDADWDTPCCSPRASATGASATAQDGGDHNRAPRRVRDVAAHLVLVDEAVLPGNLLFIAAAARRFGDPGRWDDAAIARLAVDSRGQLLAALAHRGESVARLADAVPALVGQLHVRTAFGREPLLYLLYRRVLHEWVHEHDIASATSQDTVGAATPPAPSPLVAQALALAVLHGLPALVLPHVRVTAGVVRLVVDESVVDAATAPPGRRTWGVDFARKQYGPRVSAHPDATVRIAAPTLALLAAGRLDWRQAHAAGPLLEGDASLAAALLDRVSRPAVGAAADTTRSPSRAEPSP